MTNRYVPSIMMRLGHMNYAKHYRGGAYGDAQDIEGYKVEIVPQHESVNLLIWNPKEPCVQLVIHDNDTTASLIWVGYDAKCTTDGKMEKGTGTKKMVNFAFKLAKQRGITHIELMDTSIVICKGKQIHLGPMYFLKYGMTWYEKYFGFQSNEKYSKEYEKVKQRRLERLDTSFLSEQPCEYFDEDVINKIFHIIEFKSYNWMSWIKEL